MEQVPEINFYETEILRTAWIVSFWTRNILILYQIFIEKPHNQTMYS